MKEYFINITHSGIKGMKWGVRRYRNEDGSLTPAGKARYNDNGTKKNAKDMSDEELKKANKRLQAERQYNDLTGRSYRNNGSIRNALAKGGLTSVATSLAVMGTVTARSYLKGEKLDKTLLGKHLSNSLLSGAIGGLAVGVSSLGGETKNPLV